MILFKFDIKCVRLNFKAIAKTEFSFDLKLNLLCSYDVSLFMNKKIYLLFELMNELEAAEGILSTSNVDANTAETTTSQPKSKSEGKKKKKDFTKQDGKQIALGVANKGKKKDYAKGKCFHCDEKGHWKRNCPIFRAAKNRGMKSSFLLEICLVQNPTNSWCVDSGCTNHICNSLQGFQ